jgi:hypothetical protein
MKIKKIGQTLALGTLTVGASTILGFLSFGGMFALWPLLPLAIVTFILSVGYEGEIYYQNIRSSLNKLLKSRYLQLTLSNEFLLNHFPDVSDEDCPQFFKDYAKQLKVVSKFGHKRLDADSQLRKLEADKKLRKMEGWFSAQIFSRHDQQKNLTPYRLQLQNWLVENKQQPVEEIKLKLKRRTIAFNLSKLFSAIAGLFMIAGSSYLLVGAFAVIPLLAAIPFTILPMIIVPVAVVAGVAYGMLIYNAVTNMIVNDTVRKWFFKIRDDWKKGEYFHSIFMASTTVVLGALAVALTICTAGTWWTVAKNARPILDWMTKIPTFVMGIINPIVIGLSSIVFNWQNTSETLDMIDEATRSDPNAKKKPNIFVRVAHSLKKGFEHLRARENLGQLLNPFRLILKITLAPLRLILFIGHLISMGVGDDRVPGIPQWLAATLSTTSEIFEDAHYFFDLAGGGHHHHHHHSTKEQITERHGAVHTHNHNNDLPSRMLNLIFTPVFIASAAWDSLASRFNSGDKKERLSFTEAWNKQWGIKKAKSIVPKVPDISAAWQQEQACYAIERLNRRNLGILYAGNEFDAVKQNPVQLDQSPLATETVYNANRFFSVSTPLLSVAASNTHEIDIEKAVNGF